MSAFNLGAFIKSGLINAVGKMADYQIILNSAGWLEKGVLTESDLAEIQTAIEKQYIVEETESETLDETETEIVEEIETEQTEIEQ